MGEVDVRALDGVDFALHAGELLVLLGVSGSGKSTLLNILGGLDVPSSGRIFFEDRDLTEADEDELTQYRRRNVGFVFQFYNLIPSLTARENVALVTDIAHDPLEPEEALALVGLGDRLDHFPAQLSGGEPREGGRAPLVRAARLVRRLHERRKVQGQCLSPRGALPFARRSARAPVRENAHSLRSASAAAQTPQEGWNLRLDFVSFPAKAGPSTDDERLARASHHPIATTNGSDDQWLTSNCCSAPRHERRSCGVPPRSPTPYASRWGPSRRACSSNESGAFQWSATTG